MSEEAVEATVDRTRVRTYPLNSRRLTADVIGRIAKELGLPTAGSLEETRQILDGKLVEMGREPRNVQVDLEETEGGVSVYLKDESGVFLEAQPERIEERSEENSERESDGSEDGARDGAGVREAAELEAQLLRASEENATLRGEVSAVREQLEEEKAKCKELWRMSCEQLARHDEHLASKEEEIEKLKACLSELGSGPHRPVHVSTVPRVGTPEPRPSAATTSVASSSPLLPHTPPSVSQRRGKAPPVDTFGGETAEINFEDWLSALQRAATWNAWSSEETLIQLAGHLQLRGRALQEWNLMDGSDKGSFNKAVDTLKKRLDPSSKMLAAQDFRHAAQREHEPIADYIR